MTGGVNRETLLAELAAAGLLVRAISDSGRMVLADGTIVPVSGPPEHEIPGQEPDAVAAALATGVVAAHDPAPTAAQVDQRAEAALGGVMGCVCLVLTRGELAPAVARAVVSRIAAQAEG